MLLYIFHVYVCVSQKSKLIVYLGNEANVEVNAASASFFRLNCHSQLA